MFLLPPLLPLRSLLASFALAPFRAPLSPRAEPYFLFTPFRKCIAGMSGFALPTDPVEFILHLSLRRAPKLLLPSDPVSRHRAADPLLLPGSKAHGRAHILLPCSLPHFRFGFGPIIRPQLRLGPLFFARSPAHIFAEPILSPSCRLARKMDRMSLCLMHSWHDHSCIADQTVKTYIRPCRRDAAPYPPPSDPRYSTPGFGRILLPRPGPTRSDANPPPLRRATL